MWCIYVTACRCWAGVGANNVGLDIAYNLSRATHIAKLDDDDFYYPHHLMNLKNAYLTSHKVGFVFSRARGFQDGTVEYKYGFPTYNFQNILQQAPEPCNLIHSAASWSKRHVNIRYRIEIDQYNTTRTLSSGCGFNFTRFTILADDADLFERIGGMVKNNEFISLFVPTAGVLYTTHLSKARLLNPSSLRKTISFTKKNVGHFEQRIKNTNKHANNDSFSNLKINTFDLYLSKNN